MRKRTPGGLTKQFAAALLVFVCSARVQAQQVTSPEAYFSDSGRTVTEALYPHAETARQMINAQAKAGGAEIHGSNNEEPYGVFGWFSDPDGNKIELWQPSKNPE